MLYKSFDITNFKSMKIIHIVLLEINRPTVTNTVVMTLVIQYNYKSQYFERHAST